MIFKDTHQQVQDGTKTQTRRLAKDGDHYDPIMQWVQQADGRLRWMVGNTYAVQPGRGKKATGRIRLTNIRPESLQDITPNDAIAEGCPIEHYHDERPPTYSEQGTLTTQGLIGPVAWFANLWDSIHCKGRRWTNNPNVWVLEIHPVPNPNTQK